MVWSPVPDVGSKRRGRGGAVTEPMGIASRKMERARGQCGTAWGVAVSIWLMGQAAAVPEEGRCVPSTDEFEGFVGLVEPGLRRALVAAYGADVGRDAAVDALVWAWRKWDRVQSLRNPGGYLYRVGQSAARRHLRRERTGKTVAWSGGRTGSSVSDFEPSLGRALATLSDRQRAAVLLVHGYHYTLSEAASVMGCSISTVRNHAGRALTRLREDLGVVDE